MTKPPTEGYAIRNLLTEVGAVIRYFWQSCSIDPWLLVEATTTAGLKMLASVVEPDVKELVHKGTGKSVVKHIKQSMVDADSHDPTFKSGPRTAAWSLAEKADAAAWYMFLQGSAFEAGQTWGSMIYRLADCNHHHPKNWGYAHRPFGGILTIGNWSPAFAWVEAEPNPGQVVAPLVFIPPGDSGNVSVIFEPFPLVGPVPPYSIRLRDMATGNILSQVSIDREDDMKLMAGISWQQAVPFQLWTQALLWECSSNVPLSGEFGAVTGTLYWDQSEGFGPTRTNNAARVLRELERNPDMPARGFATLDAELAERIGWRGRLTPPPLLR